METKWDEIAEEMKSLPEGKEQGEMIKEALKEAGLSQLGYSKLRGIPIRTLQNWISGKTRLGGWMMYFILKDLDDLKKFKVDK